MTRAFMRSSRDLWLAKYNERRWRSEARGASLPAQAGQAPEYETPACQALMSFGAGAFFDGRCLRNSGTTSSAFSTTI